MAYSILIVDDESNQRLMIEQALRSLGDDWQFSTASSGHEALAVLEGPQPDLIITDYHMPMMNGIELIQQIRARFACARIILITAYSSPELSDEAQHLGVNHYLTKPVSLSELRHLTSSVLAES